MGDGDNDDRGVWLSEIDEHFAIADFVLEAEMDGGLGGRKSARPFF